MSGVSDLQDRRPVKSVRCPTCHASAGQPCVGQFTARRSPSHEARVDRARTAPQREREAFERTLGYARAEGVPDFLSGPDGEEPYWVPASLTPVAAFAKVAEFVYSVEVDGDITLRCVDFMRLDIDAIREAVHDLLDEYEDDDHPEFQTWEDGYRWECCCAGAEGALPFWRFEPGPGL